MSQNSKQPIFAGIYIIHDLAIRLDTTVDQLHYLLYARPEEQRYNTFAIRKRAGGMRTISAPMPDLKAIQRQLANILQNSVDIRPSAHGFTRKRSIVTNAKLHVKRGAVLNIDLKDFFPSINFGRVRGLFMSPQFGAISSVATILAQLCTYRGYLPQGAPTSPVISNMICFRLDAQLLRLAREHRCRYSRYADDITFSTHLPSLPPEFIQRDTDGRAVAGNAVTEIVKQNGFSINPDKVRLYPSTFRQSVTGITVNSKTNVSRKFVRQVRAMIHDWSVNGLEEAQRRHHEQYYRYRDRDPKPSLQRIVRGKLDFLKMVRGPYDPVRMRLQEQLANVWPEYREVLSKEKMEIDAMYDFFVSHASEDKDAFVSPLVTALECIGAKVWFDKSQLRIGDDLYEKIDEGLRRSRYGIIVLSPSFFGLQKTWTRREINSLMALEDADGRKRILPVWYNVDESDVARNNAFLATRFAIRTDGHKAEEIATQLWDAVHR